MVFLTPQPRPMPQGVPFCFESLTANPRESFETLARELVYFGVPEDFFAATETGALIEKAACDSSARLAMRSSTVTFSVYSPAGSVGGSVMRWARKKSVRG